MVWMVTTIDSFFYISGIFRVGTTVLNVGCTRTSINDIFYAVLVNYNVFLFLGMQSGQQHFFLSFCDNSVLLIE